MSRKSHRHCRLCQWSLCSLSQEFVHLSLQDVLIGIVTSECPLLNYFLLIAKLYITIAEDLEYFQA